MRRLGTALAALVLLVGTLGASLSASAVTAVPDLKIVFSALRRVNGDATGRQHIYVLSGNGLTQVTKENSGLEYDWPSWAMNGTKIVYTARSVTEAPGAEESLYIMDASGADPVSLTDNKWQNAQPKGSPDGRSMIFSSFAPEYPRIGIFRLDLSSLLVENLSGRTLGQGALDGDPRYTDDGSKIMFASSYSPSGSQPTQIYSMNADGSGRRQLTHDDWYNTDPALSPDGRYLAYSSYRGDVRPIAGHDNPDFAFPVSDWHLIVLDLETNEEHVLTEGRDCARVRTPCLPTQGPAWVPRWTPDGKRIGYRSIVAPLEAGLYVVDRDGTNAQAIISGPSFAITYWDWVKESGTAPATAPAIGGTAPKSRMLFGGPVFDTGTEPAPSMFSSGADRWKSEEITLKDSTLVPRFARWSRDRSKIVFTARVEPARGSPTPPPPAGAERHAHFTLDDLDAGFDPPTRSTDIAKDQVFIVSADGTGVRQLTTSLTEDYLDALPEGDARGNVEPDLSPDGRYVVFTNVSTLTFESFVVRLDLQTGEVINLTSMTSGAVPVADAQPRYSPDGKRLAFVSAVGSTLQVFVMDADGYNVRAVTDDEYYNAFPTWSPDGTSVAYASYRGETQPEIDELTGQTTGGKVLLSDWYLVRVNVDTREQRVLTTTAASPVFRPAWSPEGDRIAYISAGSSRQPDIYVIAADGGTPVALAVTLRTKEQYLDWR